ncbi:hypothetical protein GCM10007423_39740 [Dyadobacter endophyticus]|uniref:Ferrous iron transport protein A n=1 Tax=Dyadobacter endophyticus TaxID=1749036 RepID=A0ABQ1YXW3_9BACT|nr:hypothetical protein [Dyadobacter endophyticus]GGH42822.1 hypothetical protein GCM10007423_39740 [Dyadobacter endophyticus]
MIEISVTITEDDTNPIITHSLRMPVGLIPNIGEEVLVSNNTYPYRRLMITGKGIIVMERGYAVACKAELVNDDE